jgi:hypothetical protein
MHSPILFFIVSLLFAGCSTNKDNPDLILKGFVIGSPEEVWVAHLEKLITERQFTPKIKENEVESEFGMMYATTIVNENDTIDVYYDFNTDGLSGELRDIIVRLAPDRMIRWTPYISDSTRVEEFEFLLKSTFGDKFNSIQVFNNPPEAHDIGQVQKWEKDKYHIYYFKDSQGFSDSYLDDHVKHNVWVRIFDKNFDTLHQSEMYRHLSNLTPNDYVIFKYSTPRIEVLPGDRSLTVGLWKNLVVRSYKSSFDKRVISSIEYDLILLDEFGRELTRIEDYLSGSGNELAPRFITSKGSYNIGHRRIIEDLGFKGWGYDDFYKFRINSGDKDFIPIIRANRRNEILTFITDVKAIRFSDGTSILK